MYRNKKPIKVETGKPASQIIPKPQIYSPSPLLENENPPAPALPQRTKISVPKDVPEESKFSFFQEMFMRMSMPTPSGVSTIKQLETGAIKSITMTYEKGLYVIRVQRPKVKS
jgi:hypothetical protein